jgi:hypothetical protein
VGHLRKEENKKWIALIKHYVEAQRDALTQVSEVRFTGWIQVFIAMLL